MKDIYNNAINTNEELKKALFDFANNNDFDYCYEVYLTAAYLDKVNEKRFAERGEYLFIPRALTAIAFEAWWQLQHNVDSYGCDWEWVFSDEGMEFILIQDNQCDMFWWGETEEEFVEYFNLAG